MSTTPKSMDVLEELESLEAIFSDELQWKKTGDNQAEYSVHYTQRKQTILTLHIDG